MSVLLAAIDCAVPDRLHLTDFMAYTRGPQDDYNKYATLVDDSGWSWASLQQYWKRVCRILLAPQTDRT